MRKSWELIAADKGIPPDELAGKSNAEVIALIQKQMAG
jgi:hypothetical protein